MFDFYCTVTGKSILHILVIIIIKCILKMAPKWAKLVLVGLTLLYFYPLYVNNSDATNWCIN